MTVSERIFTLLDEQNKRQADLVRVLNVRPNTVSDWKAKRRNPDVTHLESIARFFDVSIDYLVTGKEHTPTAIHQQGIFGDRNENNTVTINGDGAVKLTEFESELLRVYSALDARGKNALLSHAYDLEKIANENK